MKPLQLPIHTKPRPEFGITPDKQIHEAITRVLHGFRQRLPSIELQTLSSNISNFVFLQGKLNQPYITSIQNKYFSKIHKLAAQNDSRIIAVDLLEFCIDFFSTLVHQISICNERFTLETVKQQKASQEIVIDQSKKELKRKSWSELDTDKLQRRIQQHGKITSEMLKHLSQEFNRSICSVQSKIQKLQNLSKDVQDKGDNYTLQKKIIMILKRFKEGLNRESVLKELEKLYEMGQEGTWKRSASQLLSSSHSIAKTKGVYKLSAALKEKLVSDGNFKGRTIRCLLDMPGHCGTLKEIIAKYIELYGSRDRQLNAKKSKTIESSISKVLLRYDQFDRKNCKTIYRYVESKEDPFEEKSKQASEDQMSP